MRSKHQYIELIIIIIGKPRFGNKKSQKKRERKKYIGILPFDCRSRLALKVGGAYGRTYERPCRVRSSHSVLTVPRIGAGHGLGDRSHGPSGKGSYYPARAVGPRTRFVLITLIPHFWWIMNVFFANNKGRVARTGGDESRSVSSRPDNVSEYIFGLL